MRSEVQCTNKWLWLLSITVWCMMNIACGSSTTQCERDTDCPIDQHCRQDWKVCDVACDTSADCAQDQTCTSRRKCIQKETTSTPDGSPGPDTPTGSCATDETRTCYTGPTGTLGKGNCQQGTQACINGQWGACVGEIAPQEEVCNGKDDDCNGKIDDKEDCSKCQKDQDCPPAKASCRAGLCVQLCQANTECLNAERCLQGYCQPCSDGGERGQKEQCNGKDDDCDGVVDNGLASRSCYTGPTGSAGKGNCQQGTQACKGGVWGPCTGETKPITEICNGKDDDCDGSIDEIQQEVCYNGPGGTAGRGLCKSGIRSCRGGRWSACVGEVQPRTESCNQVDDDCDGTIDEGCDCTDGKTRVCGTNTGPCQAGTQTCRGGRWGTCVGEIKPKTEACNKVDDDCDGTVDEGCNCTDGDTKKCGSDRGECKSGQQTCAQGQWGSCVGEVAPQQEVCNGKDDNCDGSIDETFPGKDQACNTPASTSCWAKKIYQCDQGVKSCSLPLVKYQPLRNFRHLAFTHDNKHVAFIRPYTYPTHRIQLIDVTSTSTSTSVLPYYGSSTAKASLYGMATHSSGMIITCGSKDGVISYSKSGSSYRMTTWKGHIGCDVLHIDTAGKILVSLSDTELNVWDITTKKITQTIKLSNTERIYDSTLSGDGKTFYAAMYGGDVKKYDLITGKLATQFAAHTSYVSYIAVTKDGTRLATSSSKDKTIKIWDTATNKVLKSFYTSNYTDLSFSPDGKLLASGGSGGAYLWDTNTGKEINRIKLNNESNRDVAWSPDGTHLMTAHSSTVHYGEYVRVWRCK